MNKIAFLIPVYPPHFKYAKSLNDSFKLHQLDKQSDLWFIFTDESEKEKFGEYNNSLILPKNLRNFQRSGIINIKKFYGLNKLKNKYEYIIVLDSESLFIRNINLKEICDDFWNKKVLYGNKVLPEGFERVNPIKISCRNHFNIEKEIKNDDLYLWFNQPCIYRAETLDEFFNIISYKEKAADFSWQDFDYYIYMYYLLLYKDFIIEDLEIESNYGICEAGLDYLFFKSDKYEHCNINMCSQATLTKFDNPKLFVICHIDRDELWMTRVTNIKIDDLLQRVKRIESYNLLQRIEKLERNNSYLTQELNNHKRTSHTAYKFRKFLSIFVPIKKLRRKIRGDE